jgi:hypothetical protein
VKIMRRTPDVVSFRVTPSTKRAVLDLAIARNETLSQMMTRALHKYAQAMTMLGTKVGPGVVEDALRTLDQIAVALGLPKGSEPTDILAALNRVIQKIMAPPEDPDAGAEVADPPLEPLAFSAATMTALRSMTLEQIRAYAALRSTRQSSKPSARR